MTKRRNGNNDDPLDWRPVVPGELLEHVRHFLGTLPHELRGSMDGYTVRASDDVQTLARRLERLCEELERQRRVSTALVDLLSRHVRRDEDND